MGGRRISSTGGGRRPRHVLAGSRHQQQDEGNEGKEEAPPDEYELPRRTERSQYHAHAATTTTRLPQHDRSVVAMDPGAGGGTSSSGSSILMRTATARFIEGSREDVLLLPSSSSSFLLCRDEDDCEASTPAAGAGSTSRSASSTTGGAARGTSTTSSSAASRGHGVVGENEMMMFQRGMLSGADVVGALENMKETRSTAFPPQMIEGEPPMATTKMVRTALRTTPAEQQPFQHEADPGQQTPLVAWSSSRPSLLSFPTNDHPRTTTTKKDEKGLNDHKNQKPGAAAQLAVGKKKIISTMKIPFPLKLHYLLDDAEEEGFTDVISWVDDGKAFEVHKPEEFMKSVCHRYFQQTKFHSFVRQVYLYDFAKIERGPYAGAFYHPKFLKGRHDTSLEITRASSSAEDRRYKRRDPPRPDESSLAPGRSAMVVPPLTKSSIGKNRSVVLVAAAAAQPPSRLSARRGEFYDVTPPHPVISIPPCSLHEPTGGGSISSTLTRRGWSSAPSAAGGAAPGRPRAGGAAETDLMMMKTNSISFTNPPAERSDILGTTVASNHPGSRNQQPNPRAVDRVPSMFDGRRRESTATTTTTRNLLAPPLTTSTSRSAERYQPPPPQGEGLDREIQNNPALEPRTIEQMTGGESPPTTMGDLDDLSPSGCQQRM